MDTPTLAEWLDEWAHGRRHHLEASSVTSYRWMADSYLLPHLGEVPLDQLDVRTIEGAYATLLERGGRRGQPLAPRTVAYAHAVLHRALVDAVRLGLLEANPAAAATVPRRAVDGRAPRPLRYWDADQVRRFLTLTADDPHAQLWATALGTGMRRGELLGLRHGDVDLDRAELTVATALTLVDGRPRWKAPKTGRPRTLSLDPGTVTALQMQLARASDGAAPQRPVFTGEDGGPLHPPAISQTWRTLMRRLDLHRSGCTTCATPTRRCCSPPGCPSRSSANGSVTPRSR